MNANNANNANNDNCILSYIKFMLGINHLL